MPLSYSLRLACLIVVSLGLLQIAFEVLLWLCAPLIQRFLEGLPLRSRERALYMLQLVPLVLSLSLTVAVCIPQYVERETNFEAETVGWLCLALATLTCVLWGARLLVSIRITVRTMLFARACCCGAERVKAEANSTLIIAVNGASPRVGLVGIIRPFIFISKALMDDGSLDPLALEVVFDHERSHAAQFDNLKLLSLYSLPRLNLRLSSGRTWMQLWQSTAEWAADEDAVRGNNSRALVLAETLVSLARRAAAGHPKAACTYFICAESELAARVERLIHRSPDLALPSVNRLGFTLGLVTVGVSVVLASLASVLGDLPERLLHLG